jgi:hypothetical protein
MTGRQTNGRRAHRCAGELVRSGAVAALAPFIAGLIPRLRVPQVVVLIVGALIVGPTGYASGRAKKHRAAVQRWPGGSSFSSTVMSWSSHSSGSGQETRDHSLGRLRRHRRRHRRRSRGTACRHGIGTRIRPGGARADYDSCWYIERFRGRTGSNLCSFLATALPLLVALSEIGLHSGIHVAAKRGRSGWSRCALGAGLSGSRRWHRPAFCPIA